VCSSAYSMYALSLRSATACLFTLVALTSGQQCGNRNNYDVGVCYKYEDSIDNVYNNTATEEACCALCSVEDSCKAFQFVYQHTANNCALLASSKVTREPGTRQHNCTAWGGDEPVTGAPTPTPTPNTVLGENIGSGYVLAVIGAIGVAVGGVVAFLAARRRRQAGSGISPEKNLEISLSAYEHL
jgi:hypothetical protein